jgi:Protein of unknown function (DUF2934)
MAVTRLDLRKSLQPERKSKLKNGTRKKAKGNNHAYSKRHMNVRSQIEIRACELWRADGCPNGNDLNYWLQAEREVMSLNSGKSDMSPTGILL